MWLFRSNFIGIKRIRKIKKIRKIRKIKNQASNFLPLRYFYAHRDLVV